jgi:hypothetical protein
MQRGRTWHPTSDTYAFTGPSGAKKFCGLTAGGSRIRTLGPRSRRVDSFGEMGTVTEVTDRGFQSPTITLRATAGTLRN